jgi:hypothetical protein
MGMRSTTAIVNNQIRVVSAIDDIVIQEINARWTSASGATIPYATTLETIIICHYVDSSNYCMTMPMDTPSGAIVDIIPSGGTIVVFLSYSGGTFFDGSTSYSLSSPARFRNLGTSWSRIS